MAAFLYLIGRNSLQIVEIASKAEWPLRLGPEDLQHLQAALPSFELFVNTARLLQATDPSEDRNNLVVGKIVLPIHTPGDL